MVPHTGMGSSQLEAQRAMTLTEGLTEDVTSGLDLER